MKTPCQDQIYESIYFICILKINHSYVICVLLHSNFQLIIWLRHKRHIHDGIKDHKCKTCKSPFTTKRDLNRLTCERRHKWEVCGQTFTQKSTLMTHSNIHDNSKPYICFYVVKVLIKQVNCFNIAEPTHVSGRTNVLSVQEDLLHPVNQLHIKEPIEE